MDAEKLIEWIAFISLENEEFKKKIDQKLEADADTDTKIEMLEKLFRAKK
jgi:hypothetical protein